MLCRKTILPIRLCSKVPLSDLSPHKILVLSAKLCSIVANDVQIPMTTDRLGFLIRSSLSMFSIYDMITALGFPLNCISKDCRRIQVQVRTFIVYTQLAPPISNMGISLSLEGVKGRFKISSSDMIEIITASDSGEGTKTQLTMYLDCSKWRKKLWEPKAILKLSRSRTLQTNVRKWHEGTDFGVYDQGLGIEVIIINVFTANIPRRPCNMFKNEAQLSFAISISRYGMKKISTLLRSHTDIA